MERREGVIRGTITVLLSYFGTASFTAVLTLYLVRALGPGDYGRFSLALGVAGLMSLASDFGISSSAARFMAEALGDREAVAAIFAGAARLKLLLGSAVAALLIVLAGPIASAYGEHSLVWPLRGMALSTLMQSLMTQFSGGFLSVGRTKANLVMVVGESASELAFSLAFVLAGAGASGAAFGRAAGYGVGCGIGLFVAVRILGPSAVALHRRGGRRMATMGRYAMWLWLVNAAFSVFSSLDMLVIGAILNSAAVGQFGAPLKLSSLLAYPALAVANTVSPRIARREGAEPENALIQRSLHALVIVQALWMAPLIVWAAPIVHLLLGDGYGGSVGVLRAMAPFFFLQGIATLVSLAVNYVGRARSRLPWAVGAVVVNFIIDVTLLKAIGVVAAAIGTSVGYTLYVAGHVRICRQAFGLTLRPVVITAARCAAAVLAMAAVLFAFGTEHLSPVDWVAGIVLGLAAFGAVLLALGEFRWRDLTGALAMAQARLRPEARA